MKASCTRKAFRTTATAMELLVDLGIAREITGKRRGRLFVHERYPAILNEGTEPFGDSPDLPAHEAAPGGFAGAEGTET